MGSCWPVPTWNLRTPLRQSLQAASVKLPAELSASSEMGATQFAMMGDQSQRKARGVIGKRGKSIQAGSANAVRATFFCRRTAPYGSPSRRVA